MLDGTAAKSDSCRSSNSRSGNSRSGNWRSDLRARKAIFCRAGNPRGRRAGLLPADGCNCSTLSSCTDSSSLLLKVLLLSHQTTKHGHERGILLRIVPDHSLVSCNILVNNIDWTAGLSRSRWDDFECWFLKSGIFQDRYMDIAPEVERKCFHTIVKIDRSRRVPYSRENFPAYGTTSSN